jgi:hypothetical protein
MYFSKFNGFLFLQFYKKIRNGCDNKFEAILNSLLLKIQKYKDEEVFNPNNDYCDFGCFL